MVATVNPCGFALLPAYLSAFVGLQDRPGRLGSVGRALAVSAVLTAGFVTVFGLLGMVFSGVNMSNVKIEKALTAGMVINGVKLSDLFEAYEAAQAARSN